MLDVAVRNLTFSYRDGFAIHDVTLAFPKSTHTAIIGPAACGASTLLNLIAGTLTPRSGEVLAGARLISDLKPSRRPLLHATDAIDVPLRWSVQHALIAAVRSRSLDREDRHREYALAIEKWRLEALLERKIATLSTTERTRVHLARIELLRPAIVVADRLLTGASEDLADDLFRTLRVLGTTVISAPASRAELALTDSVVVLREGRVVQTGGVAEVFAQPVDDAAAIATGEVNVVPVTIRGTLVESAIGAWDVAAPPFQGSGVALMRPHDFAIAAPGEDSDFVFGIEEAGFHDGRWIARGFLTGGVSLRVALPAAAKVHKGRLLPMRYDPARFRLIPRDLPSAQPTVPTGVIPLLRDSR